MAAKKPPADAKPDKKRPKTAKTKKPSSRPPKTDKGKPDEEEAKERPGLFDGRKKLPGRPSKLSVDVIDQAAFLLGTGAFAITVAKAIGVSERTWYNWMDKGTEAKTKTIRKRTPNEVLCVRLVDAVEQAEAQGEIELLANCRIGTPGWQGSAWILQRRFRDRWGDSADNGGNGALADLVAAMQLARESRAAVAQ